MPRVKIAPSRQVIIPKVFWNILHLNAGDLLDVELDKENHSLIFTPKEVVDKTEVERKKWIKGLIKAGSKKVIMESEDEITADKKIKKQLYKEKYGKAK